MNKTRRLHATKTTTPEQPTPGLNLVRRSWEVLRRSEDEEFKLEDEDSESGEPFTLNRGT